MRHGEPVEGKEVVSVTIQLLFGVVGHRKGKERRDDVKQLKGRPAEDEDGHDDQQYLDDLEK